MKLYPEAGPPRLSYSKIDPTTPMAPERAKWLRVNGLRTREDLARHHVRLIRTPHRRASSWFAPVAMACVAALVAMVYVLAVVPR